MPTSTFFRLDKEKQKKLLDCAKEEFSRIPYPEVSINQIIMNAHIPRGSFYMYFQDKEDLFLYMIELYQQKLNSLVKDIITQYHGDLRKSFLNLYDTMLDQMVSEENQGMFRNIFLFFHWKKEKFIDSGHQLFHFVEEKVDSTNIKIKDLEFVFNMLVHTLFISLAETIKNNDGENKKEKYIQKIDIICYGIYKEVKHVKNI